MPSGDVASEFDRSACFPICRRFQREGIRPLRLHAMRHTWATLALESGKSVRWVADQLGHADPALTLRVYAHAMREAEPDLSFVEFSTSAAASDEDSERPETVTERRYPSPSPGGPTDDDVQVSDFIGGPSGTRTLDPRVKSPVLCQLS